MVHDYPTLVTTTTVVKGPSKVREGRNSKGEAHVQTEKMEKKEKELGLTSKFGQLKPVPPFVRPV